VGDPETNHVQGPGEETVSLEIVPFWRTLFYAFGNAAGLLLYWTFNPFIQYFYTDVKGMPPHWIGRGLFAFGFWNAINDPISGWLSDRTRTRWGRRRFFIGILAIPTAIAFALVWLPPLDADNPTALLVYFLVIISIYDLLQSIVTLNQDALFPEMYQETGNRAFGASIRQLIGFALGNGLAVAVSPMIYGNFGWGALAALWGTLACVMYFISLIGIREDAAFSEQASPTLREQIQVVFSNRTFLIVLCINFCTRFILAVLLAVMPFFAEYVLGFEDEEKLTPLLVALLTTAGISLLLWQFAIRKYGTRASMIASLGIAAVFSIPLLFVNGTIATSIVLALLGAAIGGTVLGPDLLFAEVVDDDYVRTGLRREGMYRGILGFIFRFPPAVANLILGEGLTLAGYDSDLSASAQPDAVKTVIRAFSAVLPMTAVVLGVVLLLAYPLYGKYLTDIQERATVLRQAANRRYAQKAAAAEGLGLSREE
jgi:GPH family glycoside/pentoside/hexuronide:cation symporter